MNLRPFELFLIIGFVLMGLVALALISVYKPPADPTKTALTGVVEIWGTLDKNAFYRTLEPIIEQEPAYRAITYTQIEPEAFDNQLLNALAEDRGPDLIILPHEELVSYRSKLQPITYDSFPERNFRDLYIDGAELFALNEGVYAYPLMVDPLVMYWNRDILARQNMVNPPTSWEAIVNNIVPSFVSRDFNRNISMSPIAFGEFRNVTHASDIISMLTLQGGSQMVLEGNEGRYQILLNRVPGGNAVPFESALTFYTNFASPSNPLYSWNRARPNDRDAFIGESLILYFGKGSEARSLAAQNPNLNFDIAEVPQGAGATIRRTYGTFYGLGLLRSASNRQGAAVALQLVGGQAFSQAFADQLGMAPAHRQALAGGSTDTYGIIVYRSAIMARGWLQPDKARVDTIFTQAVEDVLANRLRPSEAADDAVGRLSQEY